MLFSSGELTNFKLALSRTGVGRSTLLSGNASGQLQVGDIVEKRP
jgi:hypothetical protein